MKKKLTFFGLILVLCFCGGNKAYSNYIELNLEQQKIKVTGISVDGYDISGDFSYNLSKKDGLTFFLEGENVKFGSEEIGKVEANLTKKGNILFFNKIKTPKFSGSGTVDLKKEKILFNVSGNWQEDVEDFKGDIFLKAKIWGDFDSFLVSGNFVVNEGVYEGIPFQRLRCSFLGTPPVFNVTDAKVLLYQGSVFELRGDLDIRDPENFFPEAQFISEKLFVDGWQIFGQEKEVGLKKQIDDKFNIEIDTESEETSGTELRYSLENDNFLKLRMQEEETILGLEKKKEF